ncbi:Beta-galactosidase 7 [Ancistrocladus abbreviatus]
MFKNWGSKDPYRTAEDVAFAAARFFQYGGTFQNYYMYHGGTNFGRTAGRPYITTSYDYNAPLDEYGNLNQPKWGHLKQLHQSLKSIEKILTYGNISTTDLGNFVSVTNYTFNGTTSCFFGNANSTNDAVVTTQGGRQLTVPAWSVSILPDCENEVYNTAKTVMVGRACGHAYEGNTLELSCEGRPIKAVQFASVGDPQGTCGSFEKDNCEGSKDAIKVISNACVGKETCSLEVSEAIFGTANGDNTEKKRLAVQIAC